MLLAVVYCLAFLCDLKPCFWLDVLLVLSSFCVFSLSVILLSVCGF